MTCVHLYCVRLFRVPSLRVRLCLSLDPLEKAVKLWMQTIAPSYLQQVIIVRQGSGQVTMQGEETDSGPDIIIVPHHTLY